MRWLMAWTVTAAWMHRTWGTFHFTVLTKTFVFWKYSENVHDVSFFVSLLLCIWQTPLSNVQCIQSPHTTGFTCYFDTWSGTIPSILIKVQKFIGKLNCCLLFLIFYVSMTCVEYVYQCLIMPLNIHTLFISELVHTAHVSLNHKSSVLAFDIIGNRCQAITNMIRPLLHLSFLLHMWYIKIIIIVWVFALFPSKKTLKVIPKNKNDVITFLSF